MDISITVVPQVVKSILEQLAKIPPFAFRFHYDTGSFLIEKANGISYLDGKFNLYYKEACISIDEGNVDSFHIGL